jgi:hypothetical protein
MRRIHLERAAAPHTIALLDRDRDGHLPHPPERSAVNSTIHRTNRTVLCHSLEVGGVFDDSVGLAIDPVPPGLG